MNRLDSTGVNTQKMQPVRFVYDKTSGEAIALAELIPGDFIPKQYLMLDHEIDGGSVKDRFHSVLEQIDGGVITDVFYDEDVFYDAGPIMI